MTMTQLSLYPYLPARPKRGKLTIAPTNTRKRMAAIRSDGISIRCDTYWVLHRYYLLLVGDDHTRKIQAVRQAMIAHRKTCKVCKGER
jgi:hypothetical protein